MNELNIVKFKSNEMRKAIIRLLGKEESEYIYLEELKKIKKISINPRLFVRPTTKVDIADLGLLENLETLYLRDMDITDYQIQCLNQLNSLKNIQMNKCKFESLNIPLYLENLETLILVTCYDINMKYFKELKNLKNLKIIRSSIKSYKNFGELQSLEKVYLQNFDKVNLKSLLKINTLKYLNLDGSTVKNQKYENILKERIKLEHSKEFIVL